MTWNLISYGLRASDPCRDTRWLPLPPPPPKKIPTAVFKFLCACMFSQSHKKIGVGIVFKCVQWSIKKTSTSVTSTTSGGPGKEGEKLKAIYFTFVVTWSEMGGKKSKIVAGQHAQESNWLKLLQNTAEANKTITKGFREEKISSWKRNFSQSKLILMFSSGFCKHTIASVTHTCNGESRNLSLQECSSAITIWFPTSPSLLVERSLLQICKSNTI